MEINSETQILNYINNSNYPTYTPSSSVGVYPNCNTISEEMYPKTSIEIWQSYVPKLQLIHHHQQLSDNNTMIWRDSPRVMNCQDCGNQAKKDCAYFRCRTCCKIKGFHCPTHVKSTWVPAAKRRQRQQNLILPSSTLGILAQTATRSTSAGQQHQTNLSGLEMKSNFPWEVNKTARFRCVKVSPIEDEEEQIAYETAVNINGHIFKGLLYDEGPEPECSCCGWISPQHATAGGSGLPINAAFQGPQAPTS